MIRIVHVQGDHDSNKTIPFITNTYRKTPLTKIQRKQLVELIGRRKKFKPDEIIQFAIIVEAPYREVRSYCRNRISYMKYKSKFPRMR